MFLANRPGFVTAAVVRGDAPLLLSRPALKKLGATLDFAGDSLTLFDGQSSLALETNAAGQYTVNVSCFPEDAAALFPSRVKPSEKPEPPPAACHSVQFDKPPVGKKKDFWEFRPHERLVIRHHLKARRALFTPHMSQCPVSLDSLGPIRLTKFDVVTPHTRDRSDSWKDSMVAHTIVGHEPWTGQTIFKLSEYAIPPAFGALEEQLQVSHMSARQHRQLMAQVRDHSPSSNVGSWDVIGVFTSSFCFRWGETGIPSPVGRFVHWLGLQEESRSRPFERKPAIIQTSPVGFMSPLHLGRWLVAFESVVHGPK